jgi:hypothetical protein
MRKTQRTFSKVAFLEQVEVERVLGYPSADVWGWIRASG